MSSPTSAKADGFKVIIAGAGGAAHLPGHDRVADHAAGVRRAGAEPGAQRQSTAFIPSSRCRRASRSGTLAIGEAGATNAALLAAAVLALSDDELAERLEAHRAAQTAAVPQFPSDDD